MDSGMKFAVEFGKNNEKISKFLLALFGPRKPKILEVIEKKLVTEFRNIFMDS